MKVAPLLGAVIAFLVAVPGASADSIFTDPSGDQVDVEDLIGLDITTVEVDHTPSVIGVRVTIGNYPALPPNSRIAILFDLDKNVATGDQGFEHAVNYEIDASGAERVSFERFEPSQFSLVGVPDSAVTATYAGGTLTALVPRDELRAGVDLGFGVYAVRFGDDPRDVAGDVAPNTNLWLYEIVERRALALNASNLVRSPRLPVAGKAFAVSTVVRRSDTGVAIRGATGTVACTARLGSSRLRARGLFRGGRARCVIAIPKGAKGKRLRGTLTVRSDGASVTKRFSLRIR